MNNRNDTNRNNGLGNGTNLKRFQKAWNHRRNAQEQGKQVPRTVSEVRLKLCGPPQIRYQVETKGLKCLQSILQRFLLCIYCVF